MAVEEVLNLLDSYWFGPNILGQKLKLPTTPFVAEEEEPKISSMTSSLGIRSISARCLRYEPSSPLKDYSTSNSVNTSPKKLQKIESGKEINEFSKDEIVKNEQERQVKRSSRRRKGISRSLSDLESEELKGFIDLGFVFTEEDKDSSLVSIIPGLQRWGGLKKKLKEAKEKEKEIAKKKEEMFNDFNGSISRISRPYLSEAWEDLEKRKANRELSKWKLPALVDESNIKNQLKAWAQTVASTVK